MPHRSWLWVTLLGLGLVGLLSGCRSAPPPPPAPSAETPVGPLCQLQGRPDIPATLGEGWSFCVRQQADCNLANASEAVRLRWCVQSTAQICLDTGCKKHRAKECRLGVDAPPGAELQATPPRNTMCGKRWKCTVRAPRPSVFLCKCECPGCPGVPQARHSRAPLLPLAEGAYAVVAVWDEGFCLSGKVRVSKFEGGAFTLTTAGKCLPAGLKLRAVFARSGGAFFAVGEDPGGSGRFHLTGVVEDPDAFTGVLTRSTSLEERPQDRLRLTGRRMITTK